MIYALTTFLIVSCLCNLYLMRALGREFIKRTQLEEDIMGIKLERDFDRYMDSRYTKQGESGGNLQ